MNEWFFLSQILMIFLFSFWAHRLGKEALITAVSIQAILANLFVLKQIVIFGFEVTCSDAYTVGSILALNLLREYHGKKACTQAISISFVFMIFFVVMSNLHLRFFPGPHDTAHLAYAHLLTPAPRLLIASLGVFYLVQQFDLRAFGWISRVLPTSAFPTRTTISLVLSQLIDTVLFSFCGLYGLLSPLFPIMVLSFAVKVAIILLLGPLTGLITRVDQRV